MDTGAYRTALRTAVAVAREEQVSVKAASLGFHAFNTLIPLGLFLVVALSLVGGLEQALSTLSSVVGFQSGQLQSLLFSTTSAQSGRLRAVVLAFLILAWSVTRTLNTTNTAFDEVYGTRERGSFLRRVEEVAIATVTTPLAFSLGIGVGVVLSLLVQGTFWALLAPVVLFVALVVGFFPLYYVFPGVDISPREALPGAVFAAGLWTVSAVFFRLYATVSQSVHLYGVVGGLLIFLTWLYVGGLAVLLGVVINAVLAGRVDPDSVWRP
ncbi:YhjD/YihY/BrkB family envelope integrity protein [Halomarina oriensis]|uniref:YihY/virulence factor BrkB family protein n=1 Tax=Halomarina oriensis TaxID=671145 RepID=A0A6B0GHL7_9EURY|nr:YihY/virulence factor BrkB family protein [Halomarina oriensis]